SNNNQGQPPRNNLVSTSHPVLDRQRRPFNQQQKTQYQRKDERVQQFNVQSQPGERNAGKDNPSSNQVCKDEDRVESLGLAKTKIETLLDAQSFPNPPCARERHNDCRYQACAAYPETDKNL